jgi:predicted nucleic acid-binding protein
MPNFLSETTYHFLIKGTNAAHRSEIRRNQRCRYARLSYHTQIGYNLEMHMGKKRIYVDTTVVLGNFDKGETRRQQTEAFWSAVRSGEIVVVVSDVLRGELKHDNVEQALQFLTALPQKQIEHITATGESDDLAEQYIAEKVVGKGSFNDCRHVALATIIADGIVSWNLGDMVKRADKYNSVNVTHGYPEIKIVTPNLYKEIYNET